MSETDAVHPVAGAGSQRVDKWLFFARIVKSRTLAQKLILAGGVRVNRDKIDNPARQIRVGDTLTVSYARSVRLLEVRQPGTRRGPASEAAMLYLDRSPAAAADLAGETADAASATPPYAKVPAPEADAGRPSKKDRRALVRLKGGFPT
ncbi:RNA-binding S4 domain-containing protein [Jiella sp. MQZ9-1]|uniref:RNA-binding S4 domain-containing protein n=1 Tax=Jiella flava TaxID=2816857 RepID=A0A939JXI7_9HYPH|nr:RNA-binding S4 domain-containing protein [Jiella flava]MBO0664117.1 RNA-binding S4 domain-containing protein [Jiella flava]MCD2472689.1 RNA-binding S4 domain-containing protein [Jiella flava]